MSAVQASVSDPVRDRTGRRTNAYDYIVCGAGTTGCVVAARLADDPGIRVLVLEAGGGDEREDVMDPSRWTETLGGELVWGFEADADPQGGGRMVPYGMGRVLGGGSSVNVSVWSRGHAADWDMFATCAGERAWRYAEVLELYKREIEDWAGSPDPRHRGVSGRVHVQPAPEDQFACAALDAAAAAGIPQFANGNGELMEGAGGCAMLEETVRGGRRRSIFRAYLRPLLGRGNVALLTGACVRRVVIERGAATAVEALVDGRVRTFRAEREVVLSLGAVNTPKTLMLSGVGGGDELRAHGLRVAADLPAVGRNLHDHVKVGCVWEGRGTPAETRPLTHAFFKTDEAFDSPDFAFFARRGSAAPLQAAPGQAWSLTAAMRPEGRGRVRLGGPDPATPPKIDARYFAEPPDLERLAKGLAVLREVGNARPMAAFTVRELAPATSDRGRLATYARQGSGTFWHQSGTARMGLDRASSVVDGRLRVHGIRRLRVADASIMPRVTTGNTMAPCVVIGELAARFIAER